MLHEPYATFQARYVTAMDAWLLMCMLTVGLAIFEYAICLATLFGKQRKNKTNTKGQENAAAAQRSRCHKIDRYALRLFVAAYNMSVGTYFYIQHTA